MKPQTFLNLRRKCLFSILIVPVLLSSACVQFDTIRNSQTSFWEGYNPQYKKVYVGKISVTVNDNYVNKPSITIPGLSNFLNQNYSYGDFAANVKRNSGKTAITEFSYQVGNVISRGSIFVPIKIYDEQGAYYFGDITIKYKTNKNGVTKLDKIDVVNNPKTMEIILEKVPYMSELKRHNISEEVKSETALAYKIIDKEQKKIDKVKTNNVDKVIDSF